MKYFMSIMIGLTLFFTPLAIADEGNGDGTPTTEEAKPAEEPKAEPKAEEPKVEEKKEEAKPETKKEEEPKTDQEAVEDAVALWKAIETQNWPLAAGFFVMILVYAFNRFGLKDKIGAKAIPYVSIALGVLSAVGVALASGGSISAALAAGVTAGLAAIGSWEAVFKKVLGSESEAVEESA